VLQPKKIIFVVTRSEWGGAQRYVYDLATNLPRESFEIAVAYGGAGILGDRLRESDVRVIAIPQLERAVNLRRDLAALIALVRIFRTEAPDVIHLSSSKAGGLGAVASRIAGILNRKRPLVAFTVHGWGFSEDRKWWQRALIMFFSWLGTILQDRIIIISSADYHAARRFIPQRKLVFISHGITPFAVMPRMEARENLGRMIRSAITPQEFVIGTIAELTANKGFRYLIAAAAILREEFPTRSFRVVIAGDGELRSELEALTRERNLERVVFFLGFVPEARRYLSAFDLFVMPSQKEGLPYALMEAMRAGLAVIASRVGGIPDLVEDGVHGLLVAAKDGRALAEAISRLRNDSDARHAMAAAARRRIEGAFSLQKMIETTAAVYRSDGSPTAFMRAH